MGRVETNNLLSALWIVLSQRPEHDRWLPEPPWRVLLVHLALVLFSDLQLVGVFFFILALFGFSSLTTLGLFANERLLFMRER